MIHLIVDTTDVTYLFWEIDDATGVGIQAYVTKPNDDNDIGWWQHKLPSSTSSFTAVPDTDEDTIEWIASNPYFTVLQTFNHIDDYSIWIDRHPELLI